jgi:hypothetical protein
MIRHASVCTLSLVQIRFIRSVADSPDPSIGVDARSSPRVGDVLGNASVDFQNQISTKNGILSGMPTLNTAPNPVPSFGTATTSSKPNEREYEVPRQSRFLSYAPPQQPTTTPWQRGQESFQDTRLSTPQGNPLQSSWQRQDVDASSYSGTMQKARASPVDLHRFSGGGSTPGDPHLDTRNSPVYGATTSSDPQAPSANSAAVRGSRFAKFFDPKPKNATGVPQPNNLMPNPPMPGPLEPRMMASMQRNQSAEMNRFPPGQGTPPMQDIDGLLNMLHNSSRVSDQYVYNIIDYMRRFSEYHFS